MDEGALQAWLDGARSGLDPSKLDGIDRHIAGCDACAARADALERSSFRTHALLSVGRDQYAPRVPYEDVVRRAHGPGAPERARARARRIPATWAASIVAALAVGWMSNELAQDPLAEPTPVSATSTEAADASATEPNASLAVTGTPEQPSRTSTSDVVVDAPERLSTLAAGAAPAPDAGGLLVRGFVEDEGGRPVRSAHVYVAELDVGVLTRSDGRYDLRLASEPDSFEVTVQRIGFRQQTRAISVGEGDYVAADFRLREEALALDEIIVPGESEGDTRSIGTFVTNLRARPFVWRPAPSIAAEGYVGSDLWTLPRLDMLTLDVAYGDNANETHVARIRQDLGDGNTLTIVQGRTDERRTSWPIQSTGSVLSTWRGEMLITATAPVSADSLQALLDQLR